MKQKQQSRPLAVLVPRKPGVGDDALAQSVSADAAELLGALQMRVQPASTPTSEGLLALLRGEPRPVVVAFADVPALPPLSVEGALQDLEDHALAVGPCADGSIYLLAVAEGLDADLLEQLAAAATGDPEAALAVITDLADEYELPVSMLPPWFRLGSAKDLSFAENVARLSLMSEEGEEDFLADRLRLWFESNA